MNQDNNLPDTTTSSFDAIEEVMKSQIRRRRVLRILSSVMFLGISVFLVLFFVLPCFQASGMELSGNIYFSKDDIVSLAELDRYQASLLLDTRKAEDVLKKNAGGLLLKVEVESNGLVSDCMIQEDYPVSHFSGTTYFSSGLSLDEADRIVGNLPLSESRKSQLSLSYHKLSESSLPDIHFPKGTESSLDNAKTAFATLSGIHPDVLNSMVGIQFVNDNMDSNWSNVATVLFCDNNRYYRVDGFLTDRFSSYLPNSVFPKNAFSFIRDYIRMYGESLEQEKFCFQDSPTVYDAYHFKIVCTNGSYYLEGVKKS